MEENKLSHGIVRGFLVSVITTFFLLILLAIIMVIFDFAEGKYNYSFRLITIASLAFGSVVAAKINKRKGWVTGAIIGILFYLFIFLLSSIVQGRVLGDSEVFSNILIYGGVGTISGILGVNM